MSITHNYNGIYRVTWSDGDVDHALLIDIMAWIGDVLQMRAPR